jgi:hypothetical protein
LWSAVPLSDWVHNVFFKKEIHIFIPRIRIPMFIRFLKVKR